ncbi:MAG TPA: adenylate/guanylate cyclase domain-containing protein, partial [Candidatus Binatia bacterium]|nr:adenylate/guanylate cyclase domain-containing protein [Candidatus Binatia bacterium]
MADALPTGTVTFLFTDIERSTRLAERLGQRYQALLEDHRGVIRAAFRSEGGREVNTEGDSFFVSFSSAACAVRAALAAQRALQRHDWPDGAELRVRMGVHTGEATMVGHDYVGLEVHRAARIAAAAHGDQIVLSDATWRIVRDAVGDDVEFRDLGEHRLKDLSRPERIFQLVAP